jgi:uncharacterized protein with PIN domain
MATYIDTSVWSALLDQPGRDALTSSWDQDVDRVSSALLEAECVTVLRRAASQQPSDSSGRFLEERLFMLDRFVEGITLKYVDSDRLTRGSAPSPLRGGDPAGVGPGRPR